MNVEIGDEAALFPEKEYINRIFVTVQQGIYTSWVLTLSQCGSVKLNLLVKNTAFIQHPRKLWYKKNMVYGRIQLGRVI
jgi:hypothetical protein